MDNIAYRLLIFFLIWLVWFVIASICRSKNQKWFATELCITAFLTRSFGVLVGLIFGAICGAIEYVRYLDNKDDKEKTADPKEETCKVDSQENEDKKNGEKETKASTEESDKATIKKTKNKKGNKMKRLNKKAITIASCVILCIAVIALTVVLIQTTSTEESEYTATFYNNKGVYFYNTTQYGERMVIKYQDNTVYKIETFSGEYPSEPTPPTNEGYVFLGWYLNPECTDKYVFGYDEVNSDINLYAKWGKKSVGYN